MTQRIKNNQKFLLKLLNLHIGGYYPLRKWIGIDYKGKIDEVSHLSIAYNHYKGGKRLTTRIYQHPDLGYKLNLVLDKIPQLALLPALLQPAYGLGALALFFLTQTTYQPSDKDTELWQNLPTNNYGSETILHVSQGTKQWTWNTIIHFDISDIENNAIFSQGDLTLYNYLSSANYSTQTLSRLTRTDWVESEATWNNYKTGSSWTTAGGDYTSTNSVTVSNIFMVSSRTWSKYQLIQDCYDNQNKNVHLHLRETNSASSNTQWYSKEYTTDTTKRPKLTVTYTVPSGGHFMTSNKFW